MHFGANIQTTGTFQSLSNKGIECVGDFFFLERQKIRRNDLGNLNVNGKLIRYYKESLRCKRKRKGFNKING